jgi:outer membrane protein, heavy metal efflux system
VALSSDSFLPRKSRVRAEIAEASESLAAATEHLNSTQQQQFADTQKQYAAAITTAELLTQYRDGLVPQADAVFHSGLTGYESGKQSLTAVLTALNDVLELKRGYEQTLLDHELAVTRLETLTGAVLRWKMSFGPHWFGFYWSLVQLGSIYIAITRRRISTFDLRVCNQ